MERLSAGLEETLTKLNVPRVVCRSAEEMVAAYHELTGREMSLEQARRSNAFVDNVDGEDVVFFNAETLAGGRTAERAAAKGREITAHEVLGHYGLPVLMGEEGHKRFCGQVYGSMSEAARERFNAYYFDNNLSRGLHGDILKRLGLGADTRWEELTSEQKSLVMEELGDRMTRGAADEYIAHLAERVERGEVLPKEEKTLWDSIVDMVRRLLGFDAEDETFGDRDIAKAIMDSKRNLEDRARLDDIETEIEEARERGDRKAERRLTKERDGIERNMEARRASINKETRLRDEREAARRDHDVFGEANAIAGIDAERRSRRGDVRRSVEEEKTLGKVGENEEKGVTLQGKDRNKPRYRGWEKRSVEINTSDYEPTDEFRGLQESSVEGNSQSEYWRNEKDLLAERGGEGGRLVADILRRQLNSAGDGSGVADGVLGVEGSPDTQYTIRKNVSGKLFHDIFEIVRSYLPNGELVDLHDNYDNCVCYLSEDGTSGFAIEQETGNLVSVFNLGLRKGFLRSISDYIRKEGATRLDAYASQTQSLREIYEKTLGAKVASSMDYNMEYDHDNVAKNHGNPDVVFMIIPDRGGDTPTEVRRFGKDEYEQAEAYANSFNLESPSGERKLSRDEAERLLAERQAEPHGDDIRFSREDEREFAERGRAIEKLKPVDANKAAKEIEERTGVPFEHRRDALREFYSNIGEVVNKNDNRRVTFYKRGFDKNYREGGLFSRAVPALKEAFENSVLAYTDTEDSYAGKARMDGTLHKAHPNIEEYHNYVGKIRIGDRDYYARFTVTEEGGRERNGLHSAFVTDVKLYEEEATPTAQSGPYQLRGRDPEGVADAKLREFFERARKAGEKVSSEGGNSGDLSKSIGENFSNLDDREGVRFSVVDTDEGKTLMGVHNISEEKFRKALRLGGLANPSVAVIDARKFNHDGFGDISLITPPELIDSRTGRNAGTWLGDAWTPTFPETERQVSEKGERKIREDLQSLPEEMRSLVNSAIYMWRKGNEGSTRDKLSYLFLKERGEAPELAHSRGEKGADAYETLNKAAEYVRENGLEKEFDEWMDSLEDRYDARKVIFDGFTPSGRRRYIPATLENVSRWMKKQGRAGGQLGFASYGNATATKLKRLTKTEDIRKEKHRFANNVDDTLAFIDEWFPRLTTLERAFERGRHDVDGHAVLQGALMERNPKSFIKRLGVELSAEEEDILDGFVKAVREEYPARYFETKFERPVYLKEFAGAVVPEGTSEDIVKALNDAGLKVETYERGSLEDRKRAVNELAEAEDVRFSTEDEMRRRAGEMAVEALRKKGVDVVTDVDEMQRVLDEVRKERKGGQQYLFAGEKGMGNVDRAEAAARLDDLSVAREMEQGGKDAAAVKLATGWERGADGKWRYEVQDFGVDAKVIKDFVDKERNSSASWGILTLGDVLKNADELMEAYPELANIFVIIHRAKEMGTSCGFYDSSIKTIHLNDILLEGNVGDGAIDLRSVLLHEVQHAIQYAEGFATGGNEGMFKDSGRKRRLRELERERKRLEKLAARGEDVSDELNDVEMEIFDLERDTPFDKYTRLSGETEARNAETRRDMTAEERRRSLASETEDVSREDQIVLRNGVFYDTDGRETGKEGQFLKTADGEILGFVHEGKVYIDPSSLDANTPVHEYTHLWDTALEKGDKRLWQEGVELMRQTPLWEEVKNDPHYRDIAGDENLLASEVHSRLTGEEGRKYFEQLAKEAEAADGPLEKAQALGLMERLRHWVEKAMKWVKDSVFGKQGLTLEEFRDMPLRDLLDGGEKPSERGRGEEGDTRFGKDEEERRRAYIGKDRYTGSSRYIDYTRPDFLDVSEAFDQAIKGRYPDAKIKYDAAQTYSRYNTIKFPNGNVLKIRLSDHTPGDFAEALDNYRGNGIYWEQDGSRLVANIDISRNRMGADDLVRFADKMAECDRNGFPEQMTKAIKENRERRRQWYLDNAPDYIRHKKEYAEIESNYLTDLKILQAFGMEVEPIRRDGGEDNTTLGGEGERKTIAEIGEPKAIGRNRFGNVYDWSNRDQREAFDFLANNESGYLKGVFHRGDIGDIDLVWGETPSVDEGGGLSHIFLKHVDNFTDFESRQDAIDKIINIVNDESIKPSKARKNRLSIDKGDYKVIITESKDGRWVLSAYDTKRKPEEKKKGTPAAIPPSQSAEAVGAGAVAPNLSEGKVTTNPETAKENGENSGDLRFSTREAEEAGERAQRIVDEAEERIEAKRREEEQERANEVARGFGLDGVGEVILDKQGVRSSIAHGLRSKKAVAFAAVPDIITKGRIIDVQEDWKDRGYGSTTIAAPIRIGKGRYIGTVVLTKGQNADNFRFYLHKVSSRKDLLDGSSTTAFEADTHQGGIAKLLRNIISPTETEGKVSSEGGNSGDLGNSISKNFSDLDDREGVRFSVVEEKTLGKVGENEEKGVTLQGEDRNKPRYRGWEKRSVEINTSDYEPTDEFRGLQESNRRRGGEAVRASWSAKRCDKRVGLALADVLRRQLESSGGANGVRDGILGVEGEPDTQYTIRKNVSGKLFHDIFETVRNFTPNGELVDLHDNYDNCVCYLSEDGTSGFAIEQETGNLVSVFNLGLRKGFLRSISDYIRKEGATRLDAYASQTQSLREIYEKTLGAKVASSMDYNMEYDHDNVAKNHGNPDVVFMIIPDRGGDIPTEVRHFGKDEYEQVFPKWRLLTTHCGRRTFVVTALRLGIPSEVIMKWTGHSAFSAMRPYVKIVD